MQATVLARRAVAALSMILTTGLALAGPTITPSTLSGYTLQVTGNDVYIDGPGSSSGEEFTISTTNASDPIGVVTVRCQTDGYRIVVNIGTSLASVASVHSVKRQIVPNGQGEVWIGEMHVNGNIGTFSSGVRSGEITVNNIRDGIYFHRNIYADITATGSTQDSGSDTDIELIEGDAGSLQYWDDGNLGANVTAGDGGIGSIFVANKIGSVDSYDMTISSGDNVTTIQGAYLGKFDIDMTGSNLGTLEATVGGWGGDRVIPFGVPITDPEPDPTPSTFTESGTLDCNRLDLLTVEGNLDSAQIYVAEAPLSGASATWRIGKSFTNGSMIYLPASGLEHQIVINATDDGEDWDPGSNIIVGTGGGALTLSKEYTQTHLQVGGGAAGVGPFVMHDQSSYPQPGSIAIDGSIDPLDIRDPAPCEYHFNQIKVRFYGRIAKTGTLPGGQIEFRVQRRGLDQDDTYFSDVGEAFTVTVDTPSNQWAYINRSSGTWPVGYAYRVILRDNALKSLNVDGEPAIDGFYYDFDLYDGCLEAFDGDQNLLVNGDDIYHFSISPWDVNGSGTITSADLTSLIYGVANWPE